MQWRQEREKLLRAEYGKLLEEFEQTLWKKVFPAWRQSLQTQLLVKCALPLVAEKPWEEAFATAKEVFEQKTGGYQIQSPISDIYYDTVSE